MKNSHGLTLKLSAIFEKSRDYFLHSPVLLGRGAHLVKMQSSSVQAFAREIPLNAILGYVSKNKQLYEKFLIEERERDVQTSNDSKPKIKRRSRRAKEGGKP
jgi:hypothetical protein